MSRSNLTILVYHDTIGYWLLKTLGGTMITYPEGFNVIDLKLLLEDALGQELTYDWFPAGSPEATEKSPCAVIYKRGQPQLKVSLVDDNDKEVLTVIPLRGCDTNLISQVNTILETTQF